VGVLHFNTLLWIYNDGPKTDDDINQEKKVNTSVYKADVGAAIKAMSFIVVENFERNQNRVVNGEQDDPVVPVLHEVAIG